MSNQVSKQPKFSVVIQNDVYQKMINDTLGDKKTAQRFIASISSAVAVNKDLQSCTANSIISGALLGEGLNLSPSPQLGHYYLVPYNNNKTGQKEAQFQLGYKGYIQLAIRSGQYKRINVVAIKEGELVNYDPLSEDIEVNLIEDELKRENATTIGYYAMFRLVNGFEKSIYWSKEKMESHAIKYSNGYRAKKGYTFWETDFDGMAFKTMLRQLISKWGIMSIELQEAFTKDMGVVDGEGVNYVDNQEEIIIQDEPTEAIEAETKVTSLDDL